MKKHIKNFKLNEDAAAPARPKREVEVPARPGRRGAPKPPARPPRRRVDPAPKNQVETLIKQIIDRYNSLVGQEELALTEGLEGNLGIPQGYLDKIKAKLGEPNIQNAMAKSQEILELLAKIKEAESGMSEQEIKDKATEIVTEIFKGVDGIDLKDVEFKLNVLSDADLMDAKNPVIGEDPKNMIAYKRDLDAKEKKNLRKELDIRGIQNALTQGFATSIKDDFIKGDIEIEGISFRDYYKLMANTTDMYSDIPEEFVHMALTQSPALGRNELVWDDDKNKYVIAASGYTILILVHEMVKGVYEWASAFRDLTDRLSQEEEEELFRKSGTQHMEREGLIYGPHLVNTFNEFYDEVENNLLSDGLIDEKSPAMKPIVLAKFYQLEDDLFLRLCKAIWNEDDAADQRPYDFFEQLYLDARDDQRGGRRDDIDDIGPGGPDEPDAPIDMPGDDFMRDLLGGIDGVGGGRFDFGMNRNPVEESLSHLTPYWMHELLTEGYRESIEEISRNSGVSPKEAARQIDIFKRLADAAKSNRELQLAFINAPINVSKDLNSRINIENYKDINTLKELIRHVEMWSEVPTMQELRSGDIGAAVAELQELLGLPVTGHFNGETEKALIKMKQDISDKWKEAGVPIKGDIKKKMESALDRELDKAYYNIEELEQYRESFEQKRNQLKAQAKEARQNGDMELARNLTKEYDRQKDVFNEVDSLLRSILKATPKVDLGAIRALQIEKGIESLEGMVGGTFKLGTGKGQVVWENGDIEIIRVTSKQFCLETRESFQKTIDKYSAQITGGDNVYPWCIAQTPAGAHGMDQNYWSYRKGGTWKAGSATTLTYYMINNKKRAEAEHKRIIEWLDSGKNMREYGRKAQQEGQIQGFAQVGARTYYDDQHVTVVLAYDGDIYDLDCASNCGHGFGAGFNILRKAIWPRTWEENNSRYIPQSKRGRVPKDVIESDYYYSPTDEELEAIKAVMVNVPVSETEAKEKGAGGAGKTIVSNAGYPTAKFSDKAEYIQTYHSPAKNLGIKRKKDGSRMTAEMFRATPNKLKEAYIKGSWVGLSDEQYADISGNQGLVTLHGKFIEMWLVGDQEHEGFIDALKRIKRETENATSVNQLKRLIDYVYINFLDQNELEVIKSAELREEYETELNNVHKTMVKKLSSEDWRLGTGIDYQRLKEIKQRINFNKSRRVSDTQKDNQIIVEFQRWVTTSKGDYDIFGEDLLVGTLTDNTKAAWEKYKGEYRDYLSKTLSKMKEPALLNIAEASNLDVFGKPKEEVVKIIMDSRNIMKTMTAKLDKLALSNENFYDLLYKGDVETFNTILDAIPSSLFIGNDLSEKYIDKATDKFKGQRKKAQIVVQRQCKKSLKTIFHRIILADPTPTANANKKMPNIVNFCIAMDSPVDAAFMISLARGFYDYENPDPISSDAFTKGMDKLESQNEYFWKKYEGKTLTSEQETRRKETLARGKRGGREEGGYGKRKYID